MERIVLIGKPGSGKSTLGRALARNLSMKVIDIDRHRWPDYGRPRKTEDMLSWIDGETSSRRWIFDGNYHESHGLVLPRADTVIWLNYNAALTETRLLTRTFGRLVRGRKVTGEKGSPNFAVSLMKGANSALHWLYWRATSPMDFNGYAQALFDSNPPHLEMLRLRTPAEADRLLAATRPAAARGAPQFVG